MANAVMFHGVSPAVVECLKAELQTQGITGLDSNSGELTGDHVTIDYSLDPDAQTLTVTVVHKPFIVSVGYVTGKIHDALAGCGDASA